MVMREFASRNVTNGGLMKGTIHLFVFLLMCAVACKRGHDEQRSSVNVWDNSAYIPKSVLGPDYAALDLQTACLIRSTNGGLCAVNFLKADKVHARYECRVLKVRGSEFETVAHTTGVVALGGATPGFLCGDMFVRWLPPTTIFFSDVMSQAAITSLPVSSQLETHIAWRPILIDPR